MKEKNAFTLLELLVVIALVGFLSVLVLPKAAEMGAAGKSAVCRANLRQLYAAYRLYLDDHGDCFFPWREECEEGTLWYFGLEPKASSGGEGMRRLDKSRARLAPYFDHVGGIEVCPAFPYCQVRTKQKFEVASYGYGLNEYLIAGTPANRGSGIQRFSEIQRPAETIVWGDAAQINTWQNPASPAKPMIEEWYYLSQSPPANFHFRHRGYCQVVMADGHARSFPPAWLDQRCDGRIGFIEPWGQDYFLRPFK